MYYSSTGMGFLPSEIQYQIFFGSIHPEGMTLRGHEKYLRSLQSKTFLLYNMYGARNLEMSIRFSLKSRPSERFHRPEMSQIKAEISLRTNVKLNFHKNVGCQ